MSRTVRRKNEVVLRAKYVDDKLKVVDGKLKSWFNRFSDFTNVLPSKYVDLTPEQYIEKRKAWFHSDRRGWNASASFRRSLNRHYRSEMNRRVTVACLKMDLDNLIIDKAYSNANWEAW